MNNQYKLIEQHGAESIINALEPFVTNRRKTRIDDVITHRLDSIHLAIESPSDIHNALATVRSSEALGISTVHIITPENEARSIRKITQGAFYWATIIIHASLNAFSEYMKKEKRSLAGAVIDGAIALSDISIEKPLCLLLGNEQRGLSETARNMCDL